MAEAMPVSQERVSPNPLKQKIQEQDIPQPGTTVTEPTAVTGPSASLEVTPEKKPTDSSAMTLGKADAQKEGGANEASPTETDQTLELLAFQLADEEYAIDLLIIREIIHLVAMTPVPRVAPFIKGIISLRGTIVPIFDLRTRLGLAESPLGRRTRIVVVTLEKGLMGLIADHVTEVVKVKVNDIEPPPTTSGGLASGHLKGVTHLNGRLLILLDLEKAVAIES